MMNGSLSKFSSLIYHSFYTNNNELLFSQILNWSPEFHKHMDEGHIISTQSFEQKLLD
jgi:hypothetical protein